MIVESPFPSKAANQNFFRYVSRIRKQAYRRICLLHVYVFYSIILNCKLTLQQLCRWLMTTSVTSPGIFRLPFAMSADSFLSEVKYLPCSKDSLKCKDIYEFAIGREKSRSSGIYLTKNSKARSWRSTLHLGSISHDHMLSRNCV